MAARTKITNGTTMQKSVLEQELARKFEKLRSDMRHHDRAVLLGFIFSIIPLLPVSIIGFGICLMNYWLYRSGKLDIFERRMITIGIWFGLFNVMVGIVVTYYASIKFGAITWDSIIQAYLQLMKEFRSNLPLPWRPKELSTI